MDKINIVGQVFDTSGYSSHIKQLATALSKIADVGIETSAPYDWEQKCNDEELRNLILKKYEKETNIFIGLPHFWFNKLGSINKNFIGFCIFEGDKTPTSWNSMFVDRGVNQIWVPSNHTKQSILNGTPFGLHQYLEEKIKVIPHGVNTNLFNKQEVPKDDKFTFLMNCGFVFGKEDRKGLIYGIKAFSEEFNKEEKVRLLVKLNFAYMPIDPTQRQNFVFGELIKAGLDLSKCAEIKFIVDDMKYEDMPKLYNSADVILSPHRAEGFGLNVLEGMSCGLPHISTNYGGNTDYCNNENGWLVDYDLVRVLNKDSMKDNIGFYLSHMQNYAETSWAIPKIDSLKKALREAYTNREITKEKGLKAIEKAKEFTWEKTAELALNALNEIDKV